MAHGTTRGNIGPLLPQMAAAFEAQPDLLRAYRSDFSDHDPRALARYPASTEFLWVVRDAGTNIMALGYGIDPAYMLYWLDDDADVAAFKLTLIEHGQDGPVGKLVPVPLGVARELAMRGYHPSAADCTGYARGCGYRDPLPVLVLDGRVINHDDIDYATFLSRARGRMEGRKRVGH